MGSDKRAGAAPGAPTAPNEEGAPRAPFDESDLWVGQHVADDDILVFDPSEADSRANVLSLYSLTQHRTRSFPRSMIPQKIRVLTDEVGRARAKKAYASRDALRAEHEEALAGERLQLKERQRRGVIEAHRRYIESLGLTYRGDQATAAPRRAGRRVKCHSCGIALDNFAGAVCAICEGVLCSCGVCACGSRGSGSKASRRAAEAGDS
jgi:hypothetical protein